MYSSAVKNMYGPRHAISHFVHMIHTPDYLVLTHQGARYQVHDFVYCCLYMHVCLCVLPHPMESSRVGRCTVGALTTERKYYTTAVLL